MNHLKSLPILFLLLFFTATGCHHNTKTKQAELPIFYIQTNSGIQWEEKIPCVINYVEKGSEFRMPAQVKFRGGASSKYPKHSYSVKFPEKMSLCGLPANKSWVLNASYIDKTFMRHKLCYDLFRAMGNYNLAPQCAYVRVCENGSPQGLYLLTQRLNRRSLMVEKSDSAALIFKEPKLFFTDSLLHAKFQSSEENFHEQTYPDFEKYGDKSDIIEEFRNFILNSPTPQFKAEIGRWIDMRNVLDWHLFILFTNAADGVLKNFYLYKQNSETPFRVALWDCDHSLGRDGDNELNMFSSLPDDNRNILFDRLLKTDWYPKMMSERWKQLRQSGIISYQNIERMMKENDYYVKAGIDENKALWPFDSDFYYDANDYEQEKSLILEFVKKSLERMDKRFE
ncbi:MAG: CotH kinase family protein [Bacteroidales bacterium]|nr:CotH kinase family protein [Bacteroidales bacterium]